VCRVVAPGWVPTVTAMNIDLNAPIWGIDHLAAALGLSTDTAREKTYSATFPAPKAGFSSNLWLREDVLAWFAALPTADRSRATRRRSNTAPTAQAASIPAANLAVKGRAHKRRTMKQAAA
jgi:hypothetical protein